MMGCRRKLRGQDKSVFDIYRGMFFETIMRFIILNRPIGFYIPLEFKRLPFLIQLSFSGLPLFLVFLQLLFT